MQFYIVIIYKGIRRIINTILGYFDYLLTDILFYCNGVKKFSFTTHGIPYVMVTRGGKFVIGQNLSMNNNKKNNTIGREARCSFYVSKTGVLIIGNNVGMSSTAIVCMQEVIIEDFVKIGGNTCIYDTDFHSLNFKDRQSGSLDAKNRKTKPVLIKANAFIGAHSTILKGVVIGENSIIGACSVVTKSVPPNEIWAGNPARFIRSLNKEI